MEHVNVLLESLKFLIHFVLSEVLTHYTQRKKEKALLASVESCEQRLSKLEEIVQKKYLSD